MNNIKYFFQFLIIAPLLLSFKLMGLKTASFFGGKLFEVIGPLFRSKKIIYSNIKRVFPKISLEHTKRITRQMWNNYGRVF